MYYVSRHKVIRLAVQDGRRRGDYATDARGKLPGCVKMERRGRGERSSTTVVHIIIIIFFFLTLFPYQCTTSQEFVYGLCPARKDLK